MIDSVHVYHSKRFLVLFKLFRIMIPRQMLSTEDHKALLYFPIWFVPLFCQHPPFDNSSRILHQLISYLLDYKSLFRLKRDLIFTLKVFCKQNVPEELLCFDLWVLVDGVRVILDVLDN